MSDRLHKPPANPHAGLRGEALRAAQEGLSLRGQIEIARQQRELRELMSTRSCRPARATTKEATMAKQSTRKQSSKRTKSSATKPKQAPATSGIGIADIAKAAGVAPKDVRIVARSLGLSAGRGSSYNWPSLKSAPVKRILKALAE